MTRSLTDFLTLKLSRKILVVATYLSVWPAFDYAAKIFAQTNMPSSWYPNTGIAIGFAVYFGWPVIFLEFICRAAMSKLLWNLPLNPAHLITYVLLPGTLTWLISSRLRQIIAFEGRVDSAKIALLFLATAFFGAFARAMTIQLAAVLAGINRAEEFLVNFLLWLAGDLIGTVTLAPFVVAVLGPLLAGRTFAQPEQKKIPFLLTALLSLALFFVLLTVYQRESHYAYWHLAIALHVFAAWTLGFRWVTFQIVIVNFLLSLMEAISPSHVLPFEQQSFLAIASGVGLYLAGIFSEKSRHRESMERLSADLLNTAEEKIQFRHVLFHELRTPLAVILGYGDLMRKSPELFSSSRGLEKIKSSTQALSQIFSRLTILTNHQSAREKSRLEKIDMRELITAAAGKWSEAARKKGLTLVWNPAEMPELRATVMTECVQMVLDEVVGNAVKFTERGFVKITASVGPRRRGVRILVEDSGAGIDPSFPLFRTFGQESGGLTRSQGGLGIGLSICRMLLETMGGKISLQWSERGRGSIFLLEFFDQE